MSEPANFADAEGSADWLDAPRVSTDIGPDAAAEMEYDAEMKYLRERGRR